MARIVVFFGTTDGQTAKIVRHLAEVLRSGHDTVDVFDTRAPIPSSVFRGVDAAIIAGSVRMGKFQRALVAFLRQHREVLERIPTAFLAVSLSAARDSASARREVSKTVARFIAEIGFTPGTLLPIAGALLYTKVRFLHQDRDTADLKDGRGRYRYLARLRIHRLERGLGLRATVRVPAPRVARFGPGLRRWLAR